MVMIMNDVKKILAIVIFAGFAAASGDNSSTGSSSSSSSSPYSNVSVALSKCGDELKSANRSGKYNHLGDYAMAKAMESDQERCMAGYGHRPN
jgi:hypothetical protein|tara:strand:+ start:499 stop:777 length:279 start_codon:yes stop_codon:yes gene_type:complete